MLFRKKEEKERPRVYRLEMFFEIVSASTQYRLMKYAVNKDGSLDPEDFYWMGSGDRDWAKKIAKHFQIPINDAPLAEDE